MIRHTAFCDVCGVDEDMPDADALPAGWTPGKWKVVGSVQRRECCCQECTAAIASAVDAAIARLRGEGC